MKVLLKEDVDNLGYAGEVHTVADGYGRNYLLPKGLAVKASADVMKQAEAWRKRAESRRAEMRAEYEVLAERISAVELSFTARAGDNGRLYGSITTHQIADQLNEVLGTEIDRRKVGTEPLRQVGEHMIPVRLSGDFHPEFLVHVLEEGAPLVTAAVAETQAVEAVEELEDVAVEDTAVEDTAVEDTVEEIEEVADEEVADDETAEDVPTAEAEA